MQLPKTATLHAVENDGVLFYEFPALAALSGVRHGMSTRIGGVSGGMFGCMNLSFTRGDATENVAENYRRFCGAVGVSAERCVMTRQTHSVNVRCVTEADAGCGVARERTYDEVDGLVTDVPGLPLVILTADCVPLFFADPKRRVVAAAHSGWRGTANAIGAEVVRVMKDRYGCDPADILCGVGPSIGPCCFEVDAPVYEAFAKTPFFDPSCAVDDQNGKYHVDLWELNRRILLSAGVPAENITVGDLCTRCYPDLFWSHRATGGKRGSLAGVIALTED